MALLQEPGNKIMIDDKHKLRTIWQKKRKAISTRRRYEASWDAISTLAAHFEEHRYVLSYASFAGEFETRLVNQILSDTGKLLLPKVEGRNLHIYHVKNPIKQLKKNSWGILEPISELCQKAEISRISLALVPGLSFDASNHRLGYGRGFYDRFLPTLSKAAMAFGLGFKEQLLQHPLPTSQTDIPLRGLYLF